MSEVKTKTMMEGRATGVSVRWQGGQFCFIAADKGIVGCGIFSPEVIEEFGMAVALAKGTPERPLVEPEDLLPATIIMVSKAAEDMGVTLGMTGETALKKLLA